MKVQSARQQMLEEDRALNVGTVGYLDYRELPKGDAWSMESFLINSKLLWDSQLPAVALHFLER